MRRRTSRLLALGLFLSSLAAPGAEAQTKKVSVDSLIYDLKHPDPERRKQAAFHLGQNRIRQAVPGLVSAAADPDVEVRLEVAKALVKIDDRAALPGYLTLSADSDARIQKQAIEGIVGSYVEGEPEGFFEGVRRIADLVNPLNDDYNPTVVEPYAVIDPAAVEALVNLLRADAVDVRRAAATGLGILRARDALGAIQERISAEPTSPVLVELIRAIHKIGDPAGALPLIDLTRAPDKRVHDEAIFTLGDLRVREAAPVLMELYSSGAEERRRILKIVPVSRSDDLQKKLFQAMARIGDPEHQSLFLSALTNESDFYRRYGAEGLGRIGDASVTTEVARSFLRESSERARLAMSFALYRLGRQEHLDDLVRHARKPQVGRYLLGFEADEVVALHPYLQSEPSATMVVLLDVIGLRGDATALGEVEIWMNSEDAEVAAAANRAVRRLRARQTSASRIPLTPSRPH